jgi:hypothetical protein
MLTAPVPLPLAEIITRVMTSLDEAMGDDFSSPAQLVHFARTDGRVDLGMKNLPAGQHPVDALLGFVAPEEWDAFGALAHGWASAPGAARPSRAPDRRRVRTFHVCARDGAEVGGLHLRGAVLDVRVGGDALGMIPDATRRCVGLPTPPPESPVAELTAAEWLADIADNRGRLALPPEPYASWGDARWDVIARTRIVPGLTPMHAAWMDDGIFCRFVRSTYPPLHDGLARVRRHAAPPTVTEIMAVLRQWGLPWLDF